MKNRNLWTRNYTITTLGSAVSVIGNSLASFALSLFVFKKTGSVLDFAIYLAIFSVPQLFVPFLSGAWFDRYSNRKAIYILDFISAVIHIVLAFTLKESLDHLPFFMASILVLGTISALYRIAFKSFYPLVVPEGCGKTAYAISSNIENGSVIMFPLSAIIYNTLGITPLLLADGICLLIAAVCELFVSDVESTIPELKEPETYSLDHYLRDVKEGLKFLSGDRGLMAVVAYATAAAVGAGAGKVITIPWFIENFENGEYVYMSVWVFAIIGKLLATVLHSKIHIPVNLKYFTVLTGFLILDIVEGLYLHFPLWLMRVACFLLGFTEVVSDRLREHSLHHYIPKDMLGRYHGQTLFFETFGILAGELLVGVLEPKIELIELHIISMMFCAVCAVIIMIPNSKYLKKIYNK